jgi:hypothetical protein
VLRWKEATLTPDELNHVLEQLSMLAADANDTGDLDGWYAFQEAIDLLQDWRDDGMAGDCPVDLSAYDLNVKGAVAQHEPALAPWVQALRLAEQKLEQGVLGDAITELTALLDDQGLPVQVREQARQLLRRAQQKKAQHIDHLIQHAGTLEEAHDWDGAQQAYDEVLHLAPRHRDVQHRLDDLLIKRRAEEARALLSQENDVQALDEGVTEARQLLDGRLVDAELLVLVDRAEARRDELRTQAGDITTAVTQRGLEGVYAGMQGARHWLEQGRPKFYDVDNEAYVPITEYYADAREAWEEASTNFAERVLKRVEDDLKTSPSEARRKLRVALDTSLCRQGESVSDARERIEGRWKVRLEEDELKSSILHEETRRDLETRLEEVEKAVARQNEAVEWIAKAQDTPELETAWERLETAKEVNPGLPDLDLRIGRHQGSLVQRLAGKVRAKKAWAESLMLRHDFDDARRSCFEGIDLAGTFGEPAGAVAEEVSSIHQLLSAIDEEEQRQHRIGQWDAKIREALREGNVPLAVNLYDGLDEELRTDHRIKELSLLMADHQKLERVQAEARRAFGDRDWTHAVDLCETVINRGGPLAEWAKELHSQARAELLFTQVEKQFEQGYYRQARRTLEELLKLDERLADRCQGYLDRIAELSKGDEQVKRRLVRARREAQRDRLERALEIYKTITEAVTSYSGEIRDEYEDVQDQLRRDYVGRLEQELRKKKPDCETAFHWAETLKSYTLLWDEEDRQLWRAAAEGYHMSRIAAFEESGRWSEAVAEWERLEAAVGSTVETVEGLHHARRQATLERVDSHLHRLEHEEAESVLEDAVGLGTREDEELGLRRSIIQAMKHADVLFADGHYEDMADWLVDSHQQYGCEALSRKREKLTREAVRNLVQEAEEASSDASGGQLADMIDKYVRARSLHPEDKRAQRGIERVRAELPGVMSQVFAEATTYTSVDRPLEQSLQDARSRASRLRALLTLTTYTEQPEEWETKLSTVLNRLQVSINDLEQVRGYLSRAPKDGELWQTAIRSGEFRPLEDALRAARQIDPDLPDVREYEKHLQEAVEGHRRVTEHVAELRKAFEEDDFKGVISLCQRLRAANDLAPYVRLLAGKTRMYDSCLAEEIVGLAHHEQTANRKQKDLDIWNAWTARARELRARLEDLRGRVDRDRQPLSEVIQRLEGSLEAHSDATRHVDERPQETLSWSARDLASQAEEAADDLTRIGEDLNLDFQRAQQDHIRVRHELQPAIAEAITNKQWPLAQQLLQEAEELDPHDELTRHLRNMLEKAMKMEPSVGDRIKKKLGRLGGPL